MTLKNDSLISNFKSRWWQTYVADKAASHVEDFDVIKINMNLVMSIRQMQDVESHMQLLTSEMKEKQIVYNISTEKVEKDFRKNQTYLNVEKYQRENIENVCETLDITYQKLTKIIYRIHDMTLSHVLKFWQIIEISVLLNFFLDFIIRVCFLVDCVDLEKTWITIEFLLVIRSNFLLSKTSQYYCMFEACWNRLCMTRSFWQMSLIQ